MRGHSLRILASQPVFRTVRVRGKRTITLRFFRREVETVSVPEPRTEALTGEHRDRRIGNRVSGFSDPFDYRRWVRRFTHFSECTERICDLARHERRTITCSTNEERSFFICFPHPYDRPQNVRRVCCYIMIFPPRFIPSIARTGEPRSTPPVSTQRFRNVVFVRGFNPVRIWWTESLVRDPNIVIVFSSSTFRKHPCTRKHFFTDSRTTQIASLNLISCSANNERLTSSHG